MRHQTSVTVLVPLGLKPNDGSSYKVSIAGPLLTDSTYPLPILVVFYPLIVRKNTFLSILLLGAVFAKELLEAYLLGTFKFD